VMGGGAQSAAALAGASSQPVLYVESVGRNPRRPRPMVGRKRRPEGSRMMRKNFPHSSRCGGRRSLDADLDPAPHHLRWCARASGSRRHLSAAQSVRRRVRASTRRLCGEARRQQADRIAINGMLAGLDPHSSYMDSKSFRDMQVQTRGEFGGLGIEVTMEDGLIRSWRRSTRPRRPKPA